MKNMIITYQVKPEKLEQNKLYIQNVFKQLHALSPTRFQYASLLLEDGVSFAHVVRYDEQDDPGPLQKLPAFEEFLKDINDRCDVAPKPVTASIIGNFNIFKQ